MLGKIDAPLKDEFKKIEWGDYIIGELFEKIETKKLPYKAENLPTKPEGSYVLPCLTSSFKNQGLNYFAPKEGATILKNVISIPSNSDVYRAYYQPNEFTVLSDAYAIKWKYDSREISPNQYLFLVLCINKVTDLPIYSYKNKLGGWNVVKNKHILLPRKNGKIDFDFMESVVRCIETERNLKLLAYLTNNGLNEYVLTEEEIEAINNYEKIEWGIFNLEKLYGKSTRGKRLKSADRVKGELPFITAGETDEGVSDFIGNKVHIFEPNTTTIDMFGSAKYRNHRYGGDDHIAVVHTEKIEKNASIFVTSAIHKSSHNGQFDYGKNFYAKDADELDIMLPVKCGKPDYDTMRTIIFAIHKMLIKDVVLYANKKQLEKVADKTL